MATDSTARYDASKIDYDAMYYGISSDPVLRLTFSNGKVAVDGDGVPVMDAPVVLIRVGTFREPGEKVRRPVFQTQQIHAVDAKNVKAFVAGFNGSDVATVLAERAARVSTAQVAGF